MPLVDGAEKHIRKNLQYIRNGRKAHPKVIARLTDAQLAKLNEERASRGFPPMRPEVLFVGQHIYDSRIVKDGYSVDDVLAQIASALDEASIFHVNPRTALVSSTTRDDGYGNSVQDQGIFECSVRYPKPELQSVIPKGDHIKPRDVAPKEVVKMDMGRANAAHVQIPTDPLG
jgi:hypothetical protein